MKQNSSRDPYLYEGVPVLRNLPGIRNEDDLRAFEGSMTALAMNLVYATNYTKFNTETIRSIHRQIFGAIYEWAGEFREILIVKPEPILGGDTVRYAYPNEIKRQLDDASKEIIKLKTIKDKRELVRRLARIAAAIWQTHPFREGNTRTVISFFVLLAQHLGVEINFALFEENAAYVRNALVWASQGMYSKPEYIERIFYDAAGLSMDKPELVNESARQYDSIEGYQVSQYREIPHILENEE